MTLDTTAATPSTGDKLDVIHSVSAGIDTIL